MAHPLVQFEEADELPAAAVHAPSGWYPDPSRLRYWNGFDWTDAVRPNATPRTGARVLVPADMGTKAELAPASVDDAGAFAPSLSQVPEDVEVDVASQPAAARGLLGEMGVLALVVTLALVIGAIVTAIGIAVTA